MTIDLGTIQTLQHKDWLILVLDKKFVKYNRDKSLEFQAKIDDNGKLVLVGFQVKETTKTGS